MDEASCTSIEDRLPRFDGSGGKRCDDGDDYDQLDDQKLFFSYSWSLHAVLLEESMFVEFRGIQIGFLRTNTSCPSCSKSTLPCSKSSFHLSLSFNFLISALRFC